jgi:hypothetical protein
MSKSSSNTPVSFAGTRCGSLLPVSGAGGESGGAAKLGSGEGANQPYSVVSPARLTPQGSIEDPVACPLEEPIKGQQAGTNELLWLTRKRTNSGSFPSI